MNPVHVHLFLNHFPILGVIIAFLVFSVGLAIKNESVLKTGLGIQLFSAILAIPTFLSGESAEEIIEGMEGISEMHIEEHEEMAEVYIWLVLVLGAFSGLTFVLRQLQLNTKKWLLWIVVILSLFSIVSSVLVGFSGGEIRHPEISMRKSFQDVRNVDFSYYTERKIEDKRTIPEEEILEFGHHDDKIFRPIG